MELEIMKNAFLEIEKISTLNSHVDKFVSKEMKEHRASGSLEVDISYKDVEGNECFKSLPFSFDLELDGLMIQDILLKYIHVYVVESRGISIDYMLQVMYDLSETKEVEIIDLEKEIEIPAPEEKEEIMEEQEIKREDLEPKQEDIEKIKEDISKDYEHKLADNLKEREENKISIVTTKGRESELDFLRFFDSHTANYYSIKTLYCGNEEMLNSISKEYKIPLDVLLKGYDKQNGKVTFKYIK